MQEQTTMRDTINDSKNEENINTTQLPIINNDRRLIIHKPSDFLKNKYTFFGNTLNKDAKNYNSPKFCLKDINKQLQKGHQIVGSIIKEEKDILPNLLTNYIETYTNQQNITKLNYNTTSNTQVTSNNINITESINMNNNKRYKNNIRTFVDTNTNRNDIYSYQNNTKIINPKTERLVNLKFLVSSPKKVRSNYNNNKNNYYQFLGSQNKQNLRINNNLDNDYDYNPYININNNLQQRNYLNRGNYNSIDHSNKINNGNMNMYRL